MKFRILSLAFIVTVNGLFALAQAKAENLPSPAETEIARFERARADVLRPLIAEHKKRLTQILADLTKSGRLEDAVVAAKALKAVEPDAKEEENADGSVPSPMAGTVWRRDGGKVRFDADGTVDDTGGAWSKRGLVTRWKHYGNGVVLLTIVKGRANQLCEVWLLDKEWQKYQGYSFEGQQIEGRIVDEK